MILRFSPSSPFVRKVRIALALLGFDKNTTLERADTTDPSDSIRRMNPLGKIPVLIADDGNIIYDSRVILEYLDLQAGGGRIIPANPVERIRALRLQALCDGILDASVLIIYESRFRKKEMHEPRWLELQTGKVDRALTFLESAPPPLQDWPHVGQIALACALGYRDFRFGEGWRQNHPRLGAWLDGFAARVPAYAATKPE